MSGDEKTFRMFPPGTRLRVVTAPTAPTDPNHPPRGQHTRVSLMQPDGTEQGLPYVKACSFSVDSRHGLATIVTHGFDLDVVGTVPDETKQLLGEVQYWRDEAKRLQEDNAQLRRWLAEKDEPAPQE